MASQPSFHSDSYQNKQPLDDIRQECAEWLVRLDSLQDQAERDALETELDTWLHVSEDRQRVFRQMQSMFSSLERNPIPQRRWRMPISIVSLVAIFTFVSLWFPWISFNADYRSAATLRELVLADGSKIVLDANSAFNVNYSEDMRVIELVQGRLQVVVANDAQGRPLSVVTSHGSATALGTIYDVHLREHDSFVGVLESRVRLRAGDASEGQVIDAGQQALITNRQIEVVNDRAPYSAHWADQRLVFNDVSIEEVVIALERYRPGKTILTGSYLQNERFTGVLPIDDVDKAFDLLAGAMNLSVRHRSAYFLWLQKN